MTLYLDEKVSKYNVLLNGMKNKGHILFELHGNPDISDNNWNQGRMNEANGKQFITR